MVRKKHNLTDIPVPGVEPGSPRTLERWKSPMKTRYDSRYTIPEMITHPNRKYMYLFLSPELIQVPYLTAKLYQDSNLLLA
jgi:hypothetical protein